MKKISAFLLVGMLLLVPISGWSVPPFSVGGNLAEQVAALEVQVTVLQATVENLQNQLVMEKNARINSDSVLKTAIANEITARQQGDANTLTNASIYTDSQISDNFVPGLNDYVTVDTITYPSKPRIIFSGVNIQLVNGTNNTYTVNGMGNFIIGYDGRRPSTSTDFRCTYGLYQNKEECEVAGQVWTINNKSGSHNLVIGDNHYYSQAGGLVAGMNNTINGYFTAVSGGLNNTASGNGASVSGGHENIASGLQASVSAGHHNFALGTEASISGGLYNEAYGNYSVISGGYRNITRGMYSVVSGWNYLWLDANATHAYAPYITPNGFLTISPDPLPPALQVPPPH